MNTAATRNDWVGRVIDGRFPLLEWLGNTEQAGVFRTELNPPSAQRAVIRLTPADPQRTEEQLEDWKRAAALSHPHLMRIFASGRAQVGGVELLYVVTEYADESLHQVIPERPLSHGEAREMLGPILDALAYLHGQGMVHSRIKPANVMVAADRVKLPVESVRRAGRMSPAPRNLQVYDAPELASGSISGASDMWSLGITLVEALTQQAPLWDRSARRDPAVPGEMSHPFAAIARACLRYEAAERATPAKVKALLHAQRAVEEPANEMDQLAPVAGEALGPAPARSSRMRMMAIGGAALLIVALIVYALTRSHSAQPVAPAAQPPAPVAESSAKPAPARETPQPNTGTVKGEVAERVMPDVSAAANRTIHGTVTVTVRADVNASGTVEDARIESAGHSRYYTAKALDAARKWRFKPAQREGRSAASVWRLRFQFRRSGPEAEAKQVSP